MSSRYNPDRDPHDYYPTPNWCVHRFLDKIELPTNGLWLEPAVGCQALITAVEEWYTAQGRDVFPGWITNDIRQDAAADFYKDFTLLSTLEFFQRYEIEVFITNPPFSLADRFLEQALRLKNSQGRPPIIVMLLRLQWMATQGRCPMMQKHTPTLAILPDRPQFTTTGNGDMCEYAWHIWNHPDHEREVIVLDTTEGRLRTGSSNKNAYAPLFEKPRSRGLFAVP